MYHQHYKVRVNQYNKPFMRLDDRAYKFSIILTKLTQTTVLYLAVYNRLAYHSKVRMSNVRFLGEENIFIRSAPVKKENEKHLCLVLA